MRKTKSGESVSALLTVLLCLVVLLVPVFIAALQLLKEAQALYGSYGTNTQFIFTQWIDAHGPTLDHYVRNASATLRNLTLSLDDYAKTAASWLVLNLGTWFSSIAAIFLDLFIFFVTLYYLLRDGERLKDYLISLSPLRDEDDEHIVQKLGVAVNSVVKGKLAIAAIQGILAGVGMAIFGVPNPVVWGLVAMVASLIPPVGTALVLVPAVIFLLAAGAVPAAIGLSLWSLGVSVIDNILGPSLMGSGSDLHPLIVLISVLGGLALFGPVGLFMGPLAMALLLSLLSLYSFIARAEERQ
jgi:predicted PurR-regulated permease PerM